MGWFQSIMSGLLVAIMVAFIILVAIGVIMLFTYGMENHTKATGCIVIFLGVWFTAAVYIKNGD